MDRRRFLLSLTAISATPLIGKTATSAVVDVVVIGAGAAGLAATKKLIENDKTVLCIEANNRIGGRVYTDTAIFGVPYDIGAHWFEYGEANPFVFYGKKNGFDMYTSPLHEVVYVGNRLASKKERETYESAYEAAYKAIGDAGRQNKDISPSEVVPNAGDWSDTVHFMIGPYEMAKDFDHFSCQDWRSGEEGTDWYCREGYGTLAFHKWQGIPVELATTADKIKWGGSGVEVETNRGTIRAKLCIATVSNGVLASGQITFDPPLPEAKQAAFSGISMGVYNHVALQFKENFFGIGDDGYLTYRIENSDSSSPRGCAGLVNVGGTNLSLFDLGGNFAADMEREGKEATIDFVIGELKSIFGSQCERHLIKAHATAWASNPLTKGSYASAEPGAAHLRRELRKPVADKIFFAGEATHRNDWGTVGGADKSGRATVKKVLKLL